MNVVKPAPGIDTPATVPGPRASSAWRWVVTGLVAVAVLMRLNNAVRFPALHGYDSFGHLTYIWYLLKTGRVPLADQGWSFFHPPLYYALAAAVWAPLRALDPKRVLKLINIGFALLGLISAWVSYLIARRYFTGRLLPSWLAPLLVLFVPVGIYTAPMLGNEGLNAVLCSVAVYALLRTLQRPGWRTATLLGVSLGLALLTKATAVAVAGAAIVTLLLWAARWRRWRLGVAMVAITAAVTAVICGWYYARNLAHFGTPFPMSRGYFLVAHLENSLPQGQRGPWAYLGFDPHIFVEPLYREPPVIDSVWTGAFAGTWFEVVGGALVPSVTTDPHTRLAGQLLLGLGVVPTLIVLLGLATAVWRLARDGWDDTLMAMLVPFTCVVAMFVVFTHRVPNFTAVKSSYLMPAIVPFGFWFALGFDALARWRRLMAAALADCLVLLGVIVPVFTYQLVFTADLSGFYANAVGVLYYLAGRDQTASDMFSAIARGYQLYFAHENVAAVALDRGQPELALRELDEAARLLPEETFGQGEDRGRQIRLNLAEYASTSAYIHQLLGHDDQAIAAARHAIELAPDMPEAHYNLAVLLLRAGAVDDALIHAREACRLDPTFTESQVLLGMMEARRGGCAAALGYLRQAAGVSRPQRAYPWQTGRGDVLDAGLARRRIIDVCAAGDPYAALRACDMSLVIPWLPPGRCG